MNNQRFLKNKNCPIFQTDADSFPIYGVIQNAYEYFRDNPYIMAGMFSPLFTIFNPFFVDLFLRHSHTVTLWRMSYLVPIHLIAAYLFVSAAQYIVKGSILKKAYGLITVLLLVIFLFPFKSTYLLTSSAWPIAAIKACLDESLTMLMPYRTKINVTCDFDEMPHG